MIDSLHIAGFKLFRDLTLPKLGRMNLFVGEDKILSLTFFKLHPCAAQNHFAHGK
jgi:predicted ATPase